MTTMTTTVPERRGCGSALNGVWSQQGPKLVGTGAVTNAGQGHSVAISADGNTVIVGGPGDNPVSGGTTGAAWVYTRANGVWTQQGPKLVGTGAVISRPRHLGRLIG